MGLGGLLLGAGAGWLALKVFGKQFFAVDDESGPLDTDPTLKLLKKQFHEELAEARQSEEDLTRELEEELAEDETDLSASLADRQAQVDILEERLQTREVLQKESFQEYKTRERSFLERRRTLRELRDGLVQRIEAQAGLTRRQLLDEKVRTLRAEVEEDTAQRLRDEIQTLEASPTGIGKATVSTVLPRMPKHPYNLSGSVSLKLPKKAAQKLVQDGNGRITGLVETLLGARITAFENGRDLSIQGQDLVASELARLTLIGLIEEKRIDRDIVLSIYDEATAYFEKALVEEGKKAMELVRVRGVHPELLRYVGKLKYRTSFGQNALGHTVEVAMMAGAICSELGLDAALARRAGLLHDVGKSINVELEKSHVEVGQDLTRQFNEPDVVVNAVAYHHFEEEPRSLEAVAVQVGDAISASRPGARYESKDNYFERLDGLRNILASFKEVERGFVASAGREVRAHVNPHRFKDADMPELARRLAQKISDDLTFPGTVAVNVVREFTAVEYAK